MTGWPIKELLVGLFLLGGGLVGMQFGLCLMDKTVYANSTQKPPPNTFQWRAGAECFKEQFPWKLYKNTHP